jgi:hypothetical protein
MEAAMIAMVALGLVLAGLSAAIAVCWRRPSPRHEFIVGAIETLAQAERQQMHVDKARSMRRAVSRSA